MSDPETYTGSVAIRLYDPPTTTIECWMCDDPAQHFVRIGSVNFWACHHHAERLVEDPTEDEVKP